MRSNLNCLSRLVSAIYFVKIKSMLLLIRLIILLLLLNPQLRPEQSRKQTCSSCDIFINRSLSHGSCPGLGMCMPCFTYAVDVSRGTGSTSMESILTCSSMESSAELEPSFVHEILAVHHEVSASDRYWSFMPSRNTRTFTIIMSHYTYSLGFYQLLHPWSGREAKRAPLTNADCI